MNMIHWDTYWQAPDEGCLTDESKLQGACSKIAYVRSSEEAAQAVQYVHDRGIPLTIQGSRTGFKGGAVPSGGYVLNTSKMNQVLAFHFEPDTKQGQIRVQAGLTLETLRAILASKELDDSHLDPDSRAHWQHYCQSASTLSFLPNPTESSASIGGMVACNAHGSHAQAYGSIRRFIGGLTVILADGRRLDYEQGNTLPPSPFEAYYSPSTAPHFEAGYHMGEDWIELFCGSEGTLGLITEITLLLSEEDRMAQAVMLPLPDRDRIKAFWDGLQAGLSPLSLTNAICFHPSCFAFLASTTYRPSMELDPFLHSGMLLLEISTPSEEEFMDSLEIILAASDEAGIPDEGVMVTANPRQLSAALNLRHELIEHSLLAARAPLCSTDLYIEGDSFYTAIEQLGDDLSSEAIPGVVFGNLVTHQMSVFLTAATPEEHASAQQWLLKQLEQCSRLGYRCSSEFGVGRLKAEQFALLSHERFSQAIALREACPVAHSMNPDVFVS